MTDTDLPSLSVQVEEARRSPVAVTLTLSPEECGVLAADNGLAGVGLFAMKATVTGMKGHKLRVDGQIEADVTYICGVTLQQYDAHLDIPIEQIFARDADDAGRVDFDPLNEGDVEPLDNSAAPVAGLAYQLFTLALDPYPRHPELPPRDTVGNGETATDEPQKVSPFAVLKDLKL